MNDTLEIIGYAIKNKVTLNVASKDLFNNRNRIFNQTSRIKKKIKNGKKVDRYDEYLKIMETYNDMCDNGIIISKNNPPFEGTKNNRENVTRVVKVQNESIQEVEVKLSALNADNKMMTIEEYCEFYNLPRKDIKSWKLITHTGIPYYNIAFKEIIEILDEVNYDFITEIVKKHIKPTPVQQQRVIEDVYGFDRLVITDIHIGMDVNADGNATYILKWDGEELNKRLDKVVNTIIDKSEGDILVIDELGDYLDGWNAQTTRGGHDLPQNMNNKESFDIAVKFKIDLVSRLIPHYNKVIMNNVCEDNHSGEFGYVVNSAVKSILELKFDNVEVNNMEKFLNHYVIGSHCFILTHGKDSKHAKFGFSPILNDKNLSKIDQYCKVNKIYQKSDFIEFSKGDSHQAIFDYSTSDDFDYCNYPAFSPSSQWVQTNFKVGRSGFVFGFIEYENNIKTMTHYWF